MNENHIQAMFQEAFQKGHRQGLWQHVVNARNIQSFAEVGVFRGEFSERMLKNCPSIHKYYLIDPWRHLSDWNKPFNVANDEFVQIKEEALRRTDFAADKRIILEGKTTEVSDRIPDRSLDFAYIDGDHTLKGITIDLIKVWTKMKPGSMIGGDDFCPTIWQHSSQFEPTLIFPLAIYFAEAMNATIYGLPFNQFAILVPDGEREAFAFHDLTGKYGYTSLRDALANPPSQGVWQKCRKKMKRILGLK